MAMPADFDPESLVILVRWRTVAKRRLDGVGGAQVDPVLGRVVVEVCHPATSPLNMRRSLTAANPDAYLPSLVCRCGTWDWLPS